MRQTLGETADPVRVELLITVCCGRLFRTVALENGCIAANRKSPVPALRCTKRAGITKCAGSVECRKQRGSSETRQYRGGAQIAKKPAPTGSRMQIIAVVSLAAL